MTQTAPAVSVGRRRGRAADAATDVARTRDHHTIDDELPWRKRDLVRVAVLVVLGAVGLGLCYFIVSGEPDPATQLRWTVGAIGATAIGALGMVGWLLAGVRAVRAEKRVVVEELLLRNAPLARSQPAPRAAGGASVFVSASNMTKYHGPDCPLARSKSLHEVTVDEIARAGLAPCGVCQS